MLLPGLTSAPGDPANRTGLVGICRLALVVRLSQPSLTYRTRRGWVTGVLTCRFFSGLILLDVICDVIMLVNSVNLFDLKKVLLQLVILLEMLMQALVLISIVGCLPLGLFSWTSPTVVFLSIRMSTLLCFPC